MLRRPYRITRDPPLNCVGVTLAWSAPDNVSNTSFATLSPRCTQAAATSVRMASHQCHWPCRAATEIPRATGMNVADRNGSRVARRNSQPLESWGRIRRPCSRDTRSM